MALTDDDVKAAVRESGFDATRKSKQMWWFSRSGVGGVYVTQASVRAQMKVGTLPEYVHDFFLEVHGGCANPSTTNS